MNARLPAVAIVAILTAGMVLGVPADAAQHAAQHAKHNAKRRAESHAFGLPAPTAGSAGRHAWGGWIGSWATPDGQVVYHLDPQARRGRAHYRRAKPAVGIRYHRRAVSPAGLQQAALILSKFGAVPDRPQDAAVELAIDDLLVGGKLGLGGSTTRKRLARLDEQTRGDVLRLAGQMIDASRQQIGPYAVHLAKAGTTTPTSTPISATVTSATGQPVSRAQVTLTGSGAPVSGFTGPRGEPATLAVPRAAGGQHLTATATVPASTLFVRAPTRHRLSRAAVAGMRTTVAATTTLTPATTWTLTSEEHFATPASDTRTYQTLYSGTFQDSWTCNIAKGSSSCQDPSGDWCSHDVALNTGTWTDYTYVPADAYRGGNTCVWRDYTQTSSRLVQTGGSVTPAQEGWRPVSSTYTDAGQAATALAACQNAVGAERSCALRDNASLS